MQQDLSKSNGKLQKENKITQLQDEFEGEDDPYKIFMNFYKKMDDMEARNEPSQKKKFGSRMLHNLKIEDD